MRPNWRSYRFAVITTLAWGAFTLIFNTIAGSDYGFLNRKPANGSMLDLLGPWPTYVLVETVIVGAVWALITWPWERRRRSIPSQLKNRDASRTLGESLSGPPR